MTYTVNSTITSHFYDVSTTTTTLMVETTSTPTRGCVRHIGSRRGPSLPIGVDPDTEDEPSDDDEDDLPTARKPAPGGAN